MQKKVTGRWEGFVCCFAGVFEGVSEKADVSVWFLDGKNVVDAW
jgi:hypothetical protein